MTSVKWEPGTSSTIMTTELDLLAVDANAVSTEIDNSTDLYLFDDVEITIGEAYGSVFAEGQHLDLYLVREKLDGSGYEDGDSTIDPPAANLVGVFVINAQNYQTHTLRQISIPPAKYKYVLINQADQLQSSGNLLKRRPYQYQTV